MPKFAQQKALIIGGSLGGLFAAVSLRLIGWQVDVFERSSAEPYSRGGGIVLHREVLNALQFFRITTGEPLGVRSHDRLVLNQPGEIISQQSMPSTQTSWSVLYNALRRLIPDVNYHLGTRLVELSQKGNKVTAKFENGRTEIGDLLIGADGASSTVRRLVLPGKWPSYSGYVAWRGLVPESAVSGSANAQIYENFALQQDPDSMMLVYMVPGADGSTKVGERRFNWIWYLKANAGAELDAILTDYKGQKHEYFVPPGSLAKSQELQIRKLGELRANPIFRELICKTRDIFVQSIIDFSSPKMVFGRVLLTGDAAFVVRPHTASSTAKAAENASKLAQNILQSADLDRALNRWERQQLVAGAIMTDRGVRMGDRIMGR